MYRFEREFSIAQQSQIPRPMLADDSALASAWRFLGRHWTRVLGISAALLLPCFWHRHIEAGDLGSHLYNAWLAQLIENGQAPGLYLATPIQQCPLRRIAPASRQLLRLLARRKNRRVGLRPDFLLGRLCASSAPSPTTRSGSSCRASPPSPTATPSTWAS